MFRYLLLILILSGITNSLDAEIINVPGQHSTIQAAIDASQNGDTVLVAPGVYKENINLKGKKILLTSNYLNTNDVSTILNTVIDGGSPVDPNFASCVMMVSGEDSSTILQGFTLTNGKGSRWVDEHGAGTYREGGGILITLSSPTIRYNYIVGNEAINKAGMNSAGGGGIRVGDGNPIIRNNVIAHNKGLYGAGIVFNYTGGIIRNNIIAQNEGGQDFGGGGLWLYNVSSENHPIIVENNTIVGNISILTGGGIRIWSTVMSGKNNIVWGNSAVTAQTSNVDVSGSTAALTYNCIQGGFTGNGNISSNPLFTEGENLYVSDSSPTIDAGDPATAYNDLEDLMSPGNAKLPSKGTLRNDIGAHGGPFASILPAVSFNTKLYFSLSSVGFKQIPVGDSTSVKIDIQNSSQITAEIDSLRIMHQNGISITHYPQSIGPWSSDSLIISWKPIVTGVIVDTVKIYHNDTTQANPFILKLTGRAKTPVGVSEDIQQPGRYQLYQNYPNPFNPSTVISFDIPEAGQVTISVFNIIGEEVQTLLNEYKPAGKYDLSFTADNIPSGVYYYKIRANNFTDVKKFVLMK